MITSTKNYTKKKKNWTDRTQNPMTNGRSKALSFIPFFFAFVWLIFPYSMFVLLSGPDVDSCSFCLFLFFFYPFKREWCVWWVWPLAAGPDTDAPAPCLLVLMTEGKRELDSFRVTGAVIQQGLINWSCTTSEKCTILTTPAQWFWIMVKGNTSLCLVRLWDWFGKTLGMWFSAKFDSFLPTLSFSQWF